MIGFHDLHQRLEDSFADPTVCVRVPLLPFRSSFPHLGCHLLDRFGVFDGSPVSEDLGCQPLDVGGDVGQPRVVVPGGDEVLFVGRFLRAVAYAVDLAQLQEPLGRESLFEVDASRLNNREKNLDGPQRRVHCGDGLAGVPELGGDEEGGPPSGHPSVGLDEHAVALSRFPTCT